MDFTSKWDVEERVEKGTKDSGKNKKHPPLLGGLYMTATSKVMECNKTVHYEKKPQHRGNEGYLSVKATRGKK